jgi:hypothetical protein
MHKQEPLSLMNFTKIIGERKRKTFPGDFSHKEGDGVIATKETLVNREC